MIYTYGGLKLEIGLDSVRVMAQSGPESGCDWTRSFYSSQVQIPIAASCRSLRRSLSGWSNSWEISSIAFCFANRHLLRMRLIQIDSSGACSCS